MWLDEYETNIASTQKKNTNSFKQWLEVKKGFSKLERITGWVNMRHISKQVFNKTTFPINSNWKRNTFSTEKHFLKPSKAFFTRHCIKLYCLLRIVPLFKICKRTSQSRTGFVILRNQTSVCFNKAIAICENKLFMFLSTMWCMYRLSWNIGRRIWRFGSKPVIQKYWRNLIWSLAQPNLQISPGIKYRWSLIWRFKSRPPTAKFIHCQYFHLYDMQGWYMCYTTFSQVHSSINSTSEPQ